MDRKFGYALSKTAHLMSKFFDDIRRSSIISLLQEEAGNEACKQHKAYGVHYVKANRVAKRNN